MRIFITVRCLLRAIWPVSRPMRIRKCFLLRPKVKQASRLSRTFWPVCSGLLTGQRLQRLQCSVRAQVQIVCWAVMLEIPNTGSGPTNSDAAACLASSSTVSFPGTLLCPGTQSKHTASSYKFQTTSSVIPTDLGYKESAVRVPVSLTRLLTRS